MQRALKAHIWILTKRIHTLVNAANLKNQLCIPLSIPSRPKGPLAIRSLRLQKQGNQLPVHVDCEGALHVLSRLKIPHL